MGSSSSKALKPKVVLDLNNSSYSAAFTDEQIVDWARAKLTSEGSVCTVDDFCRIYNEIFRSGNAAPFSDNAWAMFGSDGGKINLRAMLAGSAVALRSQASEDDKLKIAFNVYDIEGSGLLTKQEIKDLLNAVSKVKGVGNAINENCDVICSTLDKDRDGKLSQSEFMVGCKTKQDLRQMFA